MRAVRRASGGAAKWIGRQEAVILIAAFVVVLALAVALLLTVLVGGSRVYLGAHYPTDVLGGWMAGLAWALLCWLVAHYLQARGAVERPGERASP